MYMRVAETLRARIGDGTYPLEDPLPSTSRLMEEFGVSVTVIRDAMRELKSEGLVQGQPGRAVYVTKKPKTVSGDSPTPSLVGLHETVRRLEERVSALEASSRAGTKPPSTDL
jgi:DNA-binding GntR family transcriptional regulator